MMNAVLIGLLLIASPNSLPSVLSVASIYFYSDNAPNYRREIRTFIEKATFRFDMKRKTMDLRDDHNNSIACRWDERAARPLGTVPNISFTCDQTRRLAVSGVLDTEHLVMLIHIDMLGAGHVSADAYAQLR